MTRREALLTLLGAVCLAVLPGCSDNELTVGGENGPISHNERALVLSVDEESQTAEVRILERPDDLTLTWGTHPTGAEGTADFSEWGSSGLPEVGDDVVLKWIGNPAEESSFPILVNSWEPTVDFYESLGDAYEVRLPADVLLADGRGAGRGLRGGAGARTRGARGRRGPGAHVHRQAVRGLPLRGRAEPR